MRVEILDTDRLIKVNKLQEITSPRLFANKMNFDDNGLLSYSIFGVSKSDRRSTFAYINLGQKFIHPHIYNKVLKGGIFKKIIYLVSGQKYFSIQDGMLVEDQENGWTGLANLYDHWNEIDWSKKESSNTTAIQVLKDLSRDQIFVDKWIVCPPAYRDITLADQNNASDTVDPLNDMYQRLIRSVGLLQEGGHFARAQYATQLKIQDILVEIHLHFKDQIAHKWGLIRRNLMGKSTDYGCRAVISAAPYNNERFEDNIVDMEHTAVPIAMCCSLFKPFIVAWLKNFFTREIINDPNLITFYDHEANREFTAKLHDPEIQFDDRHINKIIDDYCLNPDNRFKLITVTVENIKRNKMILTPAWIKLKGKEIYENNISKVLDRPMTVTDILYLAAVDVCETRHVMVSRYPVGTDKGIYFNKIRVQSTIDHVHVIFNGKDYPRYPKIDLNIQADKIGTQYIDTLVLSNSHCDGMGGPIHQTRPCKTS